MAGKESRHVYSLNALNLKERFQLFCQTIPIQGALAGLLRNTKPSSPGFNPLTLSARMGVPLLHVRLPFLNLCIQCGALRLPQGEFPQGFFQFRMGLSGKFRTVRTNVTA